MTRKSKRAGGCLPLTYNERNRYRVASSSNGGSSSAAASSSRSLLPLGFCALTLSKIDDPPLDAVVVTPSGHVYSKAALVEYYLVQTKEFQQRQEEYETALQRKEQTKQQQQATKEQNAIQQFEQLQQQRGRNNTNSSGESNKKRSNNAVASNSPFNVDYDDEPTKQKKIKRELQNSSFWLAIAQPSLQDANNNNDDNDDDDANHSPSSLKPPQRPVSPCSGQVLRRKQWREVVLERQEESGHVLCGFSGKTITTQSSVAIFPPKSDAGYVVLQQAYNEYIRPTMTCPKTNAALKESRHVVILQQHGRSTHHDDVVDTDE